MVENHSKFKAGMYLLETLTAGMYNEPLSIYREYIQNSVDSFDIIKQAKRRGPQLVKITIDPSQRLVEIYDNGAGLSTDFAERVFSNIGSSDKHNSQLRGFRGIGRLGGLAFCDRAVFVTKHSGEEVESVQEWDCRELRALLSDKKMRNMDLKSLFEKTTRFYTVNGQPSAGSYFKVLLQEVSSFRNHILDLSRVQKYLQFTAPLPFDEAEFKYADSISKYLKENVPNYGEYKIKLNGHKLCKPYSNSLRVSGKAHDGINDIVTFNLTIKDNILAYGWYGKRNHFIGSILNNNGVAGLRVKVGNLTIGDEHLLDGCFREGRFNSYMIGEVHVVSPDLIPNSRRDDFIDNDAKTLFYNSVEREIGIPLSREIRLRSRLKSNNTLNLKNDITPISVNKTENKELIPLKNRNQSFNNASLLGESVKMENELIIDSILESNCKNCPKRIELKDQLKDILKIKH